MLDPKLVKGPWTAAEDAKVVELVAEHGPQKWSLIASQLPGRIGKQCRERWWNHLNPNIKKDQWTPEEDQIILTLHQQLGNQWSAMTRFLPGRPDNAIKNRWNSSMKRRYVAQPATADANGMINLPGIGLVALPTIMNGDRGSDDSDSDEERTSKKKSVKRKLPLSGKKKAQNDSTASDANNDSTPSVAPSNGKDSDDATTAPTSAAKPKKLTKRQEASLASSASKAQAKKAKASASNTPASAPSKKSVKKQPSTADNTVTPPTRTSTRPQRKIASKNWAEQFETDSDEDEEEVANQSNDNNADDDEVSGASSSDSDDVVRELTPSNLPATPAHRRSNTLGGSGSGHAPFLNTPIGHLRTPARQGRSSISPHLVEEKKGAYAYETATPMRLSSPSAALSLASPSAHLSGVFSPPPNVTQRLRPLSTPLTNQARFHLIHPRTPASPSHLLHPSSTLGAPSTPNSRMLTMSMGLHMMASPAGYLHTPGGPSSLESDVLASNNVGGAAASLIAHDESEEPPNKKQKLNPLSVLASPTPGIGGFGASSPFINLSNRPLLHTPLLRYVSTPSSASMSGLNSTVAGSLFSSSVASPGFESFFQSPARLLRAGSTQRGKRGLDFAADGSVTPSLEKEAGFLHSPPPIHTHSTPIASGDSSIPIIHTPAVPAGMGAASVQQLLSHLKSQAANAGPSSVTTPRSIHIDESHLPGTPLPPLSSTPLSGGTATPTTALSTSLLSDDSSPKIPSGSMTDIDAPVAIAHHSEPIMFNQAEIDSMQVDSVGKLIAQSHSSVASLTSTPVHKKSTRSGRRMQDILGSPLEVLASHC